MNIEMNQALDEIVKAAKAVGYLTKQSEHSYAAIAVEGAQRLPAAKERLMDLEIKFIHEFS